MAEWSCSGLQLRVRRFDSDPSLHFSRFTRFPDHKGFQALFISFSVCPGGEIGRRKGLKIPRWQHRTGSIPVPGTIVVKPALHIVGCPRSGTTLLAEMIHACHTGILYPRHEECILDVLPDHERIRLSKKPNDHRWVKAVLNANRNLHVLAMVRDPRAVIASRHVARPGMYFCNFPVWKQSMDAIRELASHRRVMVIHYEDLIRDPGSIQQQLERFAPFLRRIHDFQEYHRVSEPSAEALDAMNGVRPLDEGRLDGWREHLSRVKQQELRFPALSEELVRLGYESDNGWTAMLEGVPAKRYPCRYDDDSNRFRLMEQRLRKTLATAAYIRRLRRLTS